MKFRIISRTKYGLATYYAQRKLFGLFWVDVPSHSASSDPRGKWPGGAETPSEIQRLVENYIEMRISGYFSEQQKVIKTYE